MLAIKIEDNTGLVGVFAAQPTDFKTGSKGYRGVSKLTINGRRYQTSIQLVEIHSKPAEQDAGDASESSADAGE